MSNLYGIDIQLSWNTTYLAYVNHTATVGVETFDTPIPPSPYASVLHEDILTILDDVNETAGTYRIACASLGFPPPPSFNGSGTAFVMAFRVIDQPAAGEEDVTLQLHFTIHHLADRHGMIIDHVAIDGTIIIYAPAMSPTVSIYTDKSIYRAGETIHLGLDIVNPGIAVNVCVAIWLERPVGGIRVILQALAITLPIGLNYSNPNFMTFMLKYTHRHLHMARGSPRTNNPFNSS